MAFCLSCDRGLAAGCGPSDYPPALCGHYAVDYDYAEAEDALLQPLMDSAFFGPLTRRLAHEMPKEGY